MKQNCENIITIDDGPSADTLNKLDILNKHNLKAIWFCLGEKLLKHPEYAIEVIKSGHILANHSFSHVSFSKSPLKSCIEEIDKTETLINELYDKAGVKREYFLFRFPFGDSGIGLSPYKILIRKFYPKWKAIQNHLKSIGMTSIIEYCPKLKSNANPIYKLRYNDCDWIWTDDSNDWKTKTMDRKRYEAQLNDFAASFISDNTIIILAHDFPELSNQFTFLVKKIA